MSPDLSVRRHGLTAALLALCGLAISVWFGGAFAEADEGIIHFDDLTHYLYAHWAWRWPAYLLDDWGRPGFTALYFLPAGLGWGACRMLSAVLSAASAFLACRIARHAGIRHSWAVIPLCYAQPLFFQLSQTTLTETALAFYLTAALCLAQRGQWNWSAAVISVGFVTRYEAAVFLPIWAYFAWRSGNGTTSRLNPPDVRSPTFASVVSSPSVSRQSKRAGPSSARIRCAPRDSPTGNGTTEEPNDDHVGTTESSASPATLPSRPWAHRRDAGATKSSGDTTRSSICRARTWRLWPLVLALLWAPVVVNMLALFAGIRPGVLRFLEPEPSGQYGQGGWLTFFCRSLEAWGPGVAVLAMVGLRGLWRRTDGGRFSAACAVGYFAAETAIRALGLFDSGGYARFLVPLSPVVAIAALVGWQRLWADRLATRRAAVVVAAGCMILLWLAMERQLVLHAARLDEAAALADLHKPKIAIRIATGVMALLAVSAIAMARPGPAAHRVIMLTPAWFAALIGLTCACMCRPLSRPVEAPIVDELRQWLAANGLANREVVSAHVWVDYATGQVLPPDRPSVRRRLEQAPIGAVFVWDRQFAASADHGLALNEFTAAPAFRLLHLTRPPPYKREPYLWVFEKVGPWGLSSPSG